MLRLQSKPLAYYRSLSQRVLAFYAKNTIAIRREDKNFWERRTPLTPDNVQKLVAEGVDVIVQPSNIRCFADDEYRSVGARVQEDVSDAEVVVAVKEVPAQLLQKDKTYMFFSHTIKAQRHNMPLLDVINEKNIRLIDFERIVDEKNARLIQFSPFAGYAGAIDTLHLVGERLLAHYGYSTPLLYISYSRNYPSLEVAKAAVRHVGDQIRKVGFPRDLSPFTIVLTGAGAVSTAAKEVLDQLPCKYVDPFELEAIWNNPDAADRHCVYVAITSAQHLAEPIPGKAPTPFNKAHYYAHPEQYRPVFHERVLPYTRVLINGMYWDQKFPRLVTTAQAQQLKAAGRLPLVAVGEIGCDIAGPIEFFVKATSLDDPIYIYNLDTHEITDNTVKGDGVAFLGVDHLPAEFPISASQRFGDILQPMIKPILESDPSKPLDDQGLPPYIKRAVIANHGQLTPDYKYIFEWRKRDEAAEAAAAAASGDKAPKKVLLLGSGFVVPPIVEYLMRESNAKLTVGSNVFNPKLVDQWKAFGDRTTTVELDVKNQSALESLIASHDIVLSLVPAPMHPGVARLCIKHKKHMVTASYISPEMNALAADAEKAGVLILNELGVDPGIDHMSIMTMLERIHARGGRVSKFTSFCGALPAPEASNNALGYKFSWSPRGVLTASQNSAHFLYNGETVEVPGDLLMDSAKKLDVYPGFSFEVIPNRDSLKYIDYYGLDSDKKALKTMMRGTLRFGGFTSVFKAFSILGLFSDSLTPADNLKTKEKKASWHDVMCAVLGLGLDTPNAAIEQHIRERVVSGLKQRRDRGAALNKYLASSLSSLTDAQISHEAERALRGIRNLGLLSQSESAELYDASGAKKTLIDVLCKLLETKLAYAANERDMIFMHHEVRAIYGNDAANARVEDYTSTLCVYGETDGGHSATAKTVGLPVAIATTLLIDGKLDALRGVQGPNRRDVYAQVMPLLERQGIKMVETERVLPADEAADAL